MSVENEAYIIFSYRVCCDIVIVDVHTSKEKCSEVKDYPGVLIIIIPHI